jgi:hypothetical protein
MSKKKGAWQIGLLTKYVYDGIKATLLDFLEPREVISREEFARRIRDYSLEYGKKLQYSDKPEMWENYSFVFFLREKICLIDRDGDNYYLNNDGERFRALLLKDEAEFKKELFVWCYEKSQSSFKSFFEFVNTLLTNVREGRELINYENFDTLVRNKLGGHNFNAQGIISLLRSLDVITQTSIGYKLNSQTLVLVESKETKFQMIYRQLREASSGGKIEFDEALSLLSEKWGTTKLEAEQTLNEMMTLNLPGSAIVIRTSRGGKYIEL